MSKQMERDIQELQHCLDVFIALSSEPKRPDPDDANVTDATWEAYREAKKMLHDARERFFSEHGANMARVAFRLVTNTMRNIETIASRSGKS